MTDDENQAPPRPTFEPHERVCGNCKLWAAHSTDHRGWVGPCRLQPQRGLFPPTAPICNAFAPRSASTVAPGTNTDSRRARTLSTTVVTARARTSVQPVVRRADGSTERIPTPPGAAGPTLSVDRPDEEIDLEGLDMTRQELVDLIREAVGEGGASAALAPKWEGGTVKLVPGRPDVQGKDLPLDTFFHKVVMVRDRLRTLEMKLNAHPKLTDAEKVEMQGYITRVYGSLTSFNLLFRDKDDHFVGAKTDE